MDLKKKNISSVQKTYYIHNTDAQTLQGRLKSMVWTLEHCWQNEGRILYILCYSKNCRADFQYGLSLMH